MCPHLEPAAAAASAGCCCCCCRPVHILMPANLLETSRQMTAERDDVGSVVAVVADVAAVAAVDAHSRPAVPIQLTVMNAHSCKPYTHNIHQYTHASVRVRRNERATRMGRCWLCEAFRRLGCVEWSGVGGSGAGSGGLATGVEINKSLAVAISRVECVKCVSVWKCCRAREYIIKIYGSQRALCVCVEPRVIGTLPASSSSSLLSS